MLATIHARFTSIGRRYGMVLVLMLLCAYYSIATNTSRPANSPDSARLLVSKLARETQSGAILLVTRDQEEDARFAEAFEAALEKKGQKIVRWIRGDPRAARQGMEDLARTGQQLQFIVTTPECGAWTILKDVGSRFPSLGRPSLLIPESVRWPTFLTRQNLLNVANQISVVAILAIGMTLVIITGGIDLSVGSVVALSAVIVSVLIRDQAGGLQATAMAATLCSGVGVLVGAVVGALTGVVVAVFKVPPFIATLAGMQVTSGLAFIAARGGSIYEVPERFTWLGRGADFFGIPNGVVLMLGLYLVAHVFMTRSVLGRWIYAAGGNPVASRYSGVSVPQVLLVVYTLCGALAGLGGVILVSQLKSGAPTYGSMIELDVIAAVVVGGTSLSGGEGRMFGTLIGALIIAVIRNGMNLTDVQAYHQKVVLGLVILGAVLVDLLKKRDWKLMGLGLWKRA